MTKILKKAGEAGTSATQLRRLNDIAQKILAEQRVSADEAKREYLDAVKLAKTKGRPKPTITKDPSFAKQDPADYLPKRYNPDTGKMEVV